MLGDHNLWRKTYAYEGSAHIPLLVKLPKKFRDGAAKRVDKAVSLYDIMPTILDFVGTPIPESVNGESLLPLIKGEDIPWREMIHGEHSQCYHPEQEMQYLTDGKAKYVWLPKINQEQLFDLTRDKMELNDLSEDKGYEKTLTRFRNTLITILEKRNNGTVVDGQLRCQKECQPQVSPYYKERLQSSDYKWV
jgi:arylsulfatase A-like enzyme